MTDLLSLPDMMNELTLIAQPKRVDLDAACSALQHMRDTYEDDRIASAKLAADQASIIDGYTILLNEDSATITDLQSNVGALTGTVTSLQTQVVALTQTNASLDAENKGLADATLELVHEAEMLEAKVATLSPDVTVTINTSAPITSAFSTAVSHVATGDLLLGDATARARAEAALAPALTYHRISAHSYGAGDPWAWNGTGTRPVDPTNWATLDNLMAMTQRMGGTPIMGFGNWPWHTKGRWNGTTTTPCTYADQLSDDGRPITERLPDVLHFVECVVKRYSVAPYNVRFWQLGGWEFHGFELDRKGTYQDWGYDAYPGALGQANMGMAFLHNQVAAKVISVAGSLGIARSALKIITNYPPMVGEGWPTGASAPIGHPLRDRVWGSVKKNTYMALLEMLKLLTPGSYDYWSYDQTSRNKDMVIKCDDWTNLQRFSDVAAYLQPLVAAINPAMTADKCIVSEWYAKPQLDPGTGSGAYRAALHAEALRRFVLAGVATALTWSTIGRADDANDGTGNTAEGWREVYQIDASIVRQAARYLPSAQQFLESL